MRKKISIALIIIGALLLISAAALVVYNNQKAEKSAEESHKVLIKMKEMIPEEFVVNKQEENFQQIIEGTHENLVENNEEKEYIEIDGNKYIGIVRIPEINVELPVMKDWSYKKMDTAPCTYSGSLEDNDFMIMAHNYKGFFIDLKNLSSGSVIEFVKCDGELLRYEVNNIETIGGWNRDALFEGDDWDITLFTCTYSGYSRVVVRADLVK